MQSGLLEQYVLGLTTDEESEEVEQYARAFPEIQAEIDMLRKAVREYAEQEIASPGFKNGKPGRQSVESTPANSSTYRPVGQWILLGCLFLLGLAGIYYHHQAVQIGRKYNALKSDYRSYQVSCNEDKEKLNNLENQLAFYQHRLTNLFQLEGTTLAPGCNVRVYWNEAQQAALLQVLSLPEPSQENQYQIWADTGNVMISLGLIDPHNIQPQSINFVAKALSLNLTLEPIGGSKEPNVKQLYANINLK